jgi:hypothetical protein
MNAPLHLASLAQAGAFLNEIHPAFIIGVLVIVMILISKFVVK